MVEFNIHGIRAGEAVKYLEMWQSRDLPMCRHIEEAAAKGIKATMALARIMPKKYDPGHRTRKTISTSALACLLYAAPIWADWLKFSSYRKILRKEARTLLLRVCVGHGNMATTAAEVIVGVVPIPIRAQ